MGVQFKSAVSSENVNNSFISKNQDDATSFKIGLNRVGSGDAIDDVQQKINYNSDDIIALDDALATHESSYVAHREFNTKANLDTWATTADDGWFAFAIDEQKSYQVISGALAEIGGGGGGLDQWFADTEYVIGNVIWLDADNKIYRCIADNTDSTFTPAKWIELSQNPYESNIEITPNNNVKIIDSVGTRVLKEQVEILHHQDFREDLPSTYLTASDATLTITDTAGNLTISGQYAVVTQSSASIGYYVESEVINVTNEDWTRAPIKIDLVQGLTGGDKGDWVAQVYESNDNVTYTAVNTTIPVTTSNQTDKLIFKLQSNTAYLKVRWTIVTANDAIDLNIGRIKITSEALPVGEQIVNEFIQYSGFLSFSTNIKFKTEEADSDYGSIVTVDNSGVFTKYVALKDIDASVSMFLGDDGTTSAANFRHYNSSGTLLKYYSATPVSISGYATSASAKIKMKAGDYVAAYTGSGSPIDSSTYTHFTISATAKADSVYVDGEIHGTIGEIVAQSGDSIPQGTLLADGSAVSRTTYAKLFGVIGTTYGVGDGSTTFNLPDYRGYFLRGWSTDATVDPSGPRAVGSSQADATAVNGLTTNSSGSHNHTVTGTNSSTFDAGGNYYVRSASSSGATTSAGTLSTSGAHTHTLSGDVETRPINKAVKYYIRYEEKTVLQIPVGAERENVYSATMDTSGNITKQAGGLFSHCVLSGTSGQTATCYFKETLPNAPTATVTPVSNAYQGNVVGIVATTTYVQFTTWNAGVSQQLGGNIFVQRNDADYKEPTAFIANAVSITNHVTGQEKELPKKLDGKKYYSYAVSHGDISSTTVLATLSPNLIFPDWLNGNTEYLKLIYVPSPTSTSDTRTWLRYTKSTGVVDILMAVSTPIYANTYVLEYLKP